MLVAMAAPLTPSLGKGPSPKIRQGPSVMLMLFANQSTRIAIAASPAPRKIELMRNSRSTVPLMPSMTRAKPEPVRITSSLAPMTRM